LKQHRKSALAEFVVYDLKGKIGGFWTKPWRDRLG